LISFYKCLDHGSLGVNYIEPMLKYTVNHDEKKPF